MQIQGACLLYPVALFGRAWWIYYDAISQGWAGLCKYQVSPSLEAGEGRKKETCQNVSKVGCSTGWGGFGFGLSLWQRRRQSVHADAFAGGAGGCCIVNRGACLHATTFCGLCLCRHDGRVVCLDSSQGRA